MLQQHYLPPFKWKTQFWMLHCIYKNYECLKRKSPADAIHYIYSLPSDRLIQVSLELNEMKLLLWCLRTFPQQVYLVWWLIDFNHANASQNDYINR